MGVVDANQWSKWERIRAGGNDSPQLSPIEIVRIK